jgi:subtilisin family serine protease
VLRDPPKEPGTADAEGDGVTAGASVSLGMAVARGIERALADGAQVIHLSLGWPGSIEVPEARMAVERAVSSAVLVVDAAGNDGSEELGFPCWYRGVV